MAGKVSTRELGLILAVRFLKTDDLHYGLWTEDLEVNLKNLQIAQARYSAYLMERIPKGVRSILDVGCGTGRLAQLLAMRGHEVDCISPSPALSEIARKRLGSKIPIHETTYEKFESSKQFDLVLFSESFQYIDPHQSLPKSLVVLNDRGYVLISDFFSLDSPGESALRGGHDLNRFQKYLGSLPFQVLFDEDITCLTAPNLDLVDEILKDYGIPLWETLGSYLRDNHPFLARMGRMVFRQRLEKIEFKYFSRTRSAAEFAKHKSYHCLLLRKNGEFGNN